MPDRFIYPLELALAAAVDRERVASAGLARAGAVYAAEERMHGRLLSRATCVRAELGSNVRGAGLFIEVDLRLRAIGAAERERRQRVAAALGEVARTRAALVETSRRRLALERHRQLACARFAASTASREAADLDEANALRSDPHRASART